MVLGPVGQLDTVEYLQETIGIKFPYEARYEQDGPEGWELEQPFLGFCVGQHVLIPATIEKQSHAAYVHVEVPKYSYRADNFLCETHARICRIEARRLWTAHAKAYKNVRREDLNRVYEIAQGEWTPNPLRLPVGSDLFGPEKFGPMW